mmetsp:Transcript_895/g.1345  ORF Transcript_895/g.1345 Transcript_895/m.1345 type:complete len:247 (-) Transcript_895:36-776(-)
MEDTVDFPLLLSFPFPLLLSPPELLLLSPVPPPFCWELRDDEEGFAMGGACCWFRLLRSCCCAADALRLPAPAASPALGADDEETVTSIDFLSLSSLSPFPEFCGEEFSISSLSKLNPNELFPMLTSAELSELFPLPPPLELLLPIPMLEDFRLKPLMRLRGIAELSKSTERPFSPASLFIPVIPGTATRSALSSKFPDVSDFDKEFSIPSLTLCPPCGLSLRRLPRFGGPPLVSMVAVVAVCCCY